MKRIFQLLFVFPLFFELSGQEVTLLTENFGQHYKMGDHITVERQFENSSVDGYNLYIPEIEKEEEPVPVIVFLQGDAAIGGAVDIVYNWALPGLLKNYQGGSQEYGALLQNTFLYVIPHINEGQYYDNQAAIETILREVANKYNVDMSRVYLTGFETGGTGTWGLASRMKNTFAAIVPVCGSNEGISDFNAIASIPIWTTHNMGDNVSDYRATSNIISSIESISGRILFQNSTLARTDISRDFLLTTARKSDHDAWTELYSSPLFFKWILRHKQN